MRCYICGMDYEHTIYGGYAQVCLCTDRVTMEYEESLEKERLESLSESEREAEATYDYERRWGA